MSAPTPEAEGFDEYATVELRRAFAGRLLPDSVPGVVLGALAHARTYPSRLRRAANPIGYLYRAGAIESGVKGEPFVVLETDGVDLGEHSDVWQVLRAMNKDQAGAAWLVLGCDWTNVQAAEALATSPNDVGELVAQARELLPPAGERVLRDLAKTRLGRVPNQPVEAEPTPPPKPPAPARTFPLKKVVRYAVPVIAALAVVAVILFTNGDADPPGAEPGAAAADRLVVERDDWTQPIDHAMESSTFALAKVGTSDPIFVANLARAQEPLLPASTFKLLNSLIILDAGVVGSIDEEVPWDGVTRGVDAWNQDHSLSSGLRVSAVWLFQELAREVGSEAMADGVESAAYGNADTGGDLDSFWLDGDLRISAVEQLAFLEDLATQALPFAASDQRELVSAMNVAERDGYTVRYKTGSALRGDPPVAWLVGLITSDAQEEWVFAYNTDMAVSDGELVIPTEAERLAVVYELFGTAGDQ